MSLHPSQLQQCVQITDDIRQSPLSIPFLEPYDYIKHGVQNYPNVIKTPMDLTTVQERLDSGYYTTISDWQKDMTLIWDNAIKYEGEQSNLGIMAKQLLLMFKEKTKFMSDDRILDWKTKFDYIGTRIKKLLFQNEKAFDKQAYSEEKQEELDDSIAARSLKGRKNRNMPMNYRADGDEIQIPDSSDSESESEAQAYRKPHPVRRRETHSNKGGYSSRRGSISKEEMVQIADQVNSLEDDWKIEQVAALIEKMNGSIGDEIEIEKLKPETIRALKQLLNNFEEIDQ